MSDSVLCLLAVTARLCSPTAMLCRFWRTSTIIRSEPGSRVAAAATTAWTSHRYYLRPDTAPKWLRVDLGLSLSGCDSSAEFDAAIVSAADEPRNATDLVLAPR